MRTRKCLQKCLQKLLGTAVSTILFCSLSNKIGCKPITFGGGLIATPTSCPLRHLISPPADPALTRAHDTITTMVQIDTSTYAFQLCLTGTARLTKPCDIANATLARLSVNTSIREVLGQNDTVVKIGNQRLISSQVGFQAAVVSAVRAAGYRASNPTVLKLNGPFYIFSGQAFTLVTLPTLLVELLPTASATIDVLALP